MRELATLRGYVRDVAREQGLRVGSAGTHPFSLFERQRITAKDRYHALDRPAPVRRAARADLRDAHPRRGRRSGQGDPGRERPAPAPRAAPRALGELAVLARGADGPRLEPADRLLGLPPLGPAAALPRLRGLRAVVGQLERTGLHRRLHAHLVGHPPAPAAGGRSRCASATPSRASRTRSRSPRTARRSSSSSRERYDAGEEIPSYHRILTSENKWLAARYGLDAPVMDLATGSRNRSRSRKLVRRTLRDLEPHARELGSERELEGIARDPRPRQLGGAPAPRLQREPRHRRGRTGDRGRDRAGGRRRVRRLSSATPSRRTCGCRCGRARHRPAP